MKLPEEIEWPDDVFAPTSSMAFLTNGIVVQILGPSLYVFAVKPTGSHCWYDKNNNLIARMSYLFAIDLPPELKRSNLIDLIVPTVVSMELDS
jgi:hypothetical protein